MPPELAPRLFEYCNPRGCLGFPIVHRLRLARTSTAQQRAGPPPVHARRRGGAWRDRRRVSSPDPAHHQRAGGHSFVACVLTARLPLGARFVAAVLEVTHEAAEGGVGTVCPSPPRTRHGHVRGGPAGMAARNNGAGIPSIRHHNRERKSGSRPLPRSSLLQYPPCTSVEDVPQSPVGAPPG